MASISFESVGKSFGAVEVIKELDLEIRDGSFTAFVGPSGCGKSTLLRLLAGLENITRGCIKFDGRVVNEMGPVERGIAMVFQNYALYPHMTVAQNIGFGLRMARIPSAKRREMVRNAAELLQLTEYLDRRPAQLSGGQRQRVAIGRAIVRSPSVFLFDEPLSNLDAELRASMRIEIARLHDSIDATMIYVTHDQVEAMTLADQLIVLRAGNVEQKGTPGELYEDPDNQFVAGFIGSPRMNFLSGRSRRDESGGCHVELGDGQTLQVGATGGPVEPELIVGIRPEHFLQSRDAPNQMRVRADFVEDLGGVRHVVGTLPTGEPVTVEVRGKRRVRKEEMPVGVMPEHVYLFGKSGRRIR